MAITFIQQRKKQQYFIAAFVFLSLIIFSIFAINFLRQQKTVLLPTVLEPKKIKIDLGILEEPALKEFQPFEVIGPFEDDIGRENPFLPYK